MINGGAEIKGQERNKFGVVLFMELGRIWEGWEAQGWGSQTCLVSQVRIQCPVHLQRGL